MERPISTPDIPSRFEALSRTVTLGLNSLGFSGGAIDMAVTGGVTVRVTDLRLRRARLARSAAVGSFGRNGVTLAGSSVSVNRRLLQRQKPSNRLAASSV